MARPYCARADIEARFGEQNLWKWADYDGTVTSATISANITTAISDAGDLFDDMMRDGIYDLPVASSGGSTPNLVKKINVQLAAVECYTNRGIVDYDPVTGEGIHLLTGAERSAKKTIEDLNNYPRTRVRVDAVLKTETDGTATSMVPEAVAWFSAQESTNPNDLSVS